MPSDATCPSQVTPYATSGGPQAPTNFSLNYTNQDFWSMKARLIDFINQRFGPNGSDLPGTFNDLVEGDLAVMLIESWAYLADLLSFKMDQQVNEIFIDTVTEVDNAFRLAKAVGFQPTPPIAATAMFTATINSPLSVDLSIDTPVSVDIGTGDTAANMELFPADSTNSPILDQPIVILAGSTSTQNIIGLEGTTHSETLAGSGGIGQSLQLSYTPVIYDSVRVQVDGTQWTQVDAFTDSQPRREFRVEYDASYNAYLIFGNGRAGLIPSANSQIVATYRVGGGTAGNVTTGSVETQLQVPVSGLAYSIPVTVQNYTAGKGGYAGDGVDDIRRKLPAYISTQGRIVSGTDYTTYTDQFVTPYHGQVGKSTVALRNYGCAGNIIDLYILASDGNGGLVTASNDLKVDLTEAVADLKMLTDNVCVRDGVVLPTDISIDLSFDKFYRKFEIENRAAAQQQLNAFFALSNWDFGQSLKGSDIVKALSANKEVNEIEVQLTTSDPNNSGSVVTANFYEIIVPDSISITFVYN